MDKMHKKLLSINRLTVSVEVATIAVGDGHANF